MNAYAQHGVSSHSETPGRLAGVVRTALQAWMQARAQRHESERLWQLAIADAHALAEQGRAMSREAVPGMQADSVPH